MGTVTKIYSLRDQSGLTRYIGKTTRPLSIRLSHHIAESRAGKQTWKHNWIRSLLAKGHKPSIHLIEMVEGDGCREEIKWITKFHEMHWPLVNLTNGGEGLKGFKPHFSSEHRAKISAAKKGKTFSESHCLAISVACRGRKRHDSPEGIARRSAAVSAACKGKRLSLEHRIKLSQSKKRSTNHEKQQQNGSGSNGNGTHKQQHAH